MPRFGLARVAPTLCILATVLVEISSASPPRNPRPQRGADLIDMMLWRDAIFLGTVDSTTSVMRPPDSSTGDHFLWARTQIHMRVDTTLLGILLDTTAVLTLLAGFHYAPAELPPGTKLLAWARRDEDDDWRFAGGIGVIDSLNRVHVRNSGWTAWIRGLEPCSPFALVDVERELASRRKAHAAEAYEGAEGLALIQLLHFIEVHEVSGPEDRIVEYGYVFEDWLAGDSLLIASQHAHLGARPSGIMRMRVRPGCYPLIGPGTELLVPVSIHEMGDTVRTEGCPYGWRLRGCFVPSLGVPVDRVNDAVMVGADSRVHLRPYIRK